MGGTGLFISLAMILLAYMLGAIPFGLLISKFFCGKDPRSEGSGNTGATNVARLCGKPFGALTLLCDLLKGSLAVLLSIIALKQFPEIWKYTPLAAAFSAIFAHMFPVFLRFKGGKGVATTVGVYLTLAFFPALIAIMLCLITIKRSGFVSAGSLVMVSTMPVFCFFMGYKEVAILSCLTGALVLYAHRENIDRLRKGEEKSWTKNRKNEEIN